MFFQIFQRAVELAKSSCSEATWSLLTPSERSARNVSTTLIQPGSLFGSRQITYRLHFSLPGRRHRPSAERADRRGRIVGGLHSDVRTQSRPVRHRAEGAKTAVASDEAMGRHRIARSMWPETAFRFGSPVSALAD